MSDLGWVREQKKIGDANMAHCISILKKYNMDTSDPYNIDCESECPGYRECTEESDR